MRRLPLLLVLLAAVPGACGGEDSPVAATPTPAADSTTEAGCRKVEAPEPKGQQKLPRPTLQLARGKRYVAEVTTSCGAFEITLDVRRAPRTAASFVSLARKGFFDGTTFHRISPGFVIQGGDPLGDGTGGPGYSVREAPPADLQYLRGVVAMAKTGAEPPGTSGSQFFVVTGEDAQLTPDYALLGRVTGGRDVVDAIGTAPVVANSETPVDPIVIESIAIREE